MVSKGDRFLEMLVQKEHFYLFSRSSIREFFHRLQAEYLEFEPAIFSHYDMFLVVSRAPLVSHSSKQVEKALNASPSGRMVQGLSDLYTQKQQLLQKYNESEADRAARLEVINRLNRVHPIVRVISSNRAFQILQKLGLLGRTEDKISQALASTNFEKQEDSPERESNLSSTPGLNISRIAIDLTPLVPGGQNPGEKLLAIELVRNLSKLLPYCEFVLLTSDISHDELSNLDSPNVRRLCVRHQKTLTVSPISPRLIGRMRIRMGEWLPFSLPPPLLARVKATYRSWWAPRRPSSRIIRELEVNLLLCPFTVPFFTIPQSPLYR